MSGLEQIDGKGITHVAEAHEPDFHDPSLVCLL
jgi:hypothetical protein